MAFDGMTPCLDYQNYFPGLDTPIASDLVCFYPQLIKEPSAVGRFYGYTLPGHGSEEWVYKDAGISRNSQPSTLLFFFFLMPPESKIRGHIDFGLSVCLSVCLFVHGKNFNIGDNFWMVSDMAFNFSHVYSCDKTFLLIPNFWPRDLDLDLWPTFQKLKHWPQLLNCK